MRLLENVSRLLAASVLILAASAWIASPAGAGTWAESGDAGNHIATAQATAGSGALTQITGTFTNVEDVDVYCIRVPDPKVFYAGIQCLVMTDPDIWIFDPNSIGLSHNDTCAGGDTEVTGLFVPAAGTYYLAVAHGGRQAQSPGGAIWQTQLFLATERAPDGPGAPGPLTAWSGGGIPTTLTSYVINLQGATFCSPVTPTVPSAWGELKVLYR
jgi:hypothetical protein